MTPVVVLSRINPVNFEVAFGVVFGDVETAKLSSSQIYICKGMERLWALHPTAGLDETEIESGVQDALDQLHREQKPCPILTECPWMFVPSQLSVGENARLIHTDHLYRKIVARYYKRKEHEQEGIATNSLLSTLWVRNSRNNPALLQRDNEHTTISRSPLYSIHHYM